MDESISSLDEIEAHALVEVVRRAFGYDFTEYSIGSQLRRLKTVAAWFGCASISELQHRILHQPGAFAEFLSRVNISVTGFFRDPAVFHCLQQEVIPFLKTYSRFKVWHAGCASGAELYSFAIMLKQAGILERSRLYGTDINPLALAQAREGVFKISELEKAFQPYKDLGYQDELLTHFSVNFGAALIHRSFRERALFSDHNLVSDANFGCFELILCRNVFIYFGEALQERIITLFWEALEPGGYLCLGTREGLLGNLSHRQFECVDRPNRLYRKRGEQ